MTFFRCLIPLIFLFFSGCTMAEMQGSQQPLATLTPFAYEQRPVVAVFPFHCKGDQEEYSQLSSKLIDLVSGSLFKTKRFRVLERSRLDAILKEVELGQTGIIAESEANRLGRQLGAELVLVGSLTAIKPIQKRDSIGVAWRETRGFEITLQGRLIDIDRGEIVAVAEATGIKVQEEKMAMGANTGAVAPDETLLNMALESASSLLIHDLAQEISPKDG